MGTNTRTSVSGRTKNRDLICPTQSLVIIFQQTSVSSWSYMSRCLTVNSNINLTTAMVGCMNIARMPLWDTQSSSLIVTQKSSQSQDPNSPGSMRKSDHYRVHLIDNVQHAPELPKHVRADADRKRAQLREIDALVIVGTLSQ